MKYTLPFLIIISLSLFACDAKKENKVSDNNISDKSQNNQPAQTLKWHAYNAGVKKAAKENKKVLIDFYADWCRYCKIMDKETFANANVIKELNKHYVAIRIHTDKKTGEKINFKKHSFSAKEFAGGLGITGLPTVVFMNSKQDIITKVPGYIKADRFLPMLKYMKDECYSQDIKFPEYLKDSSICSAKKT